MTPPQPKLIVRPGGRTQRAPQAIHRTRAEQMRFDDLGNDNLQLSTTLFISLFQVKDVSGFPLSDWLNNAESVLRAHGMKLDIEPASKQPRVLDYNGGKINDQNQANEIRQSASRAFDDHANPLRCPVIFCLLSQQVLQDAVGLTFADHARADLTFMMPDGTTWLPFCLVDAAAGNAFASTVIHEMGHAAGLEHANSGGDSQNIMHPVGGSQQARSKLNGVEVRAYASAYFARPRIAPPYKLF